MNRNKSILFVTALAEPERGGGIENTLFHLTNALSAKGHRCTILSLDSLTGLRKSTRGDVHIWRTTATSGYEYWGEQWDFAKRNFLKRQFAHATQTYNPFLQSTLRKVISIESPDIISFHNLSNWSVASWKTAARSGKPVLQVLHDYSSLCINGTMRNKAYNCETPCRHCQIRRITTKPYSTYLTAVAGVSHYVLNRHTSLGIFDNVPIKRVIHNARLSSLLGVSAPIACNRSCIRFGYIGRMDPNKGIKEMIEAFRKANIINAELWLAGADSSGYLKSLLGEESASNIKILGHVRPQDFYPHVDVVIVPSLWNEPLGNVVFESLAYGKPVLGANRGGIPEMIKSEESGILFDPEDQNSFVEALVEIASNNAHRNRLAESAPKAATYFLDVNRWTAQYESLYAAMLSHKANGFTGAG